MRQTSVVRLHSHAPMLRSPMVRLTASKPVTRGPNPGRSSVGVAQSGRRAAVRRLFVRVPVPPPTPRASTPTRQREPAQNRYSLGSNPRRPTRAPQAEASKRRPAKPALPGWSPGRRSIERRVRAFWIANWSRKSALRKDGRSNRLPSANRTCCNAPPCAVTTCCAKFSLPFDLRYCIL